MIKYQKYNSDYNGLIFCLSPKFGGLYLAKSYAQPWLALSASSHTFQYIKYL